MPDQTMRERVAEVRRLHRPVNRCDVGEHGDRCPGSECCANCRRLWPCKFYTAALTVAIKEGEV